MAQGLVTVQSSFSPKETVEKLAAAIERRDMTIFARIDHAAGAVAVGLPLRSTEVLIFGSPRAGTPLMQAVQTSGIDLPLKILVWQDSEQSTQLSYNDPDWIAARHSIEGLESVFSLMSAVLRAIAEEATEEAGTPEQQQKGRP